MLPEKIIILGVIVNLVFSIFYVKNILKGNTRPNLISWTIWMLAPMVGFFLLLKGGATWSALAVFMAGFGPFLVIIFSLFKKNAFWKINFFDLVCGLFSIIAIVFYLITKNLTLAILFAIFSDLLAYLPTYLKTWKNPETENFSVYFGGIFNNIIALLIIKDWYFYIYIFSVYLIVANLIEISFIYRKKFFKLKSIFKFISNY